MKTLPWENYRPDNWENWRLKFAAPLITDRGNQNLQQLEYLGMENVESWTGKLVRTELNDEANEEKDILQTTGIAFDSYHVLFGKLRPYLAKVFLPNSSGICSTEFLVLEPIKSINRKYLFYTLLTKEFIATVNASTFGSKMPRANWDFIGSQSVPVPPISEQNKIVNYLDRETTQIDNLIAAKEQMLTLLEEKREALISHAVTRGLDPNVSFKRSGLDWLGDIPQHWDVIRLKHLAKEALAYGANEAALEDNPSYPRFIRITDIKDDGSLRPETFKSLSPEVAKPYLLSDGDVLLARSGATVGKAFIYRKEWGTACFAGYLIRCRCNKELLIPSFLFYYTQSSCYWSQVYAGTIQATIQNFSGEKYGDIFIPIPPLSEQKDILNFLDYETSKLDGLLGAIKESISLLKERRSALITAAVTGQITLEEMTS